MYGDSDISPKGNGAVIITSPDTPINLAETEAMRTPSSITLSWTEGLTNGGSAVIDYRVNYDQATGDYVQLADSIVANTYTATGLTFGLVYTFRIEARNEFGYSELSQEIAILCAAVPEAPAVPSTTVDGANVIFNWDAPVANGTPLTGYKVYIRQSDQQYVIDTSVCNGFNTNVILNTECTLTLNKLITTPFNLLKGYSIYIKVAAVNAYGDSISSEPGNGGIIVLVPDAPTSL